jgi:hypothetical protein
MGKKQLDASVLELDYDKEIERIGARLRELLSKEVMRRGFVCAMSGGIDSSVSSALCVKALGPDKVYGIMLPERDSSGFNTARGKQLAEHLKIRHEVFDIAPALEGIGCYRQRDEAMQELRGLPERNGWIGGERGPDLAVEEWPGGIDETGRRAVGRDVRAEEHQCIDARCGEREQQRHPL